MPRYFFHIKEGDKITVDEEGEEFDTVEKGASLSNLPVQALQGL
jgi:hypothetical protein